MIAVGDSRFAGALGVSKPRNLIPLTKAHEGREESHDQEGSLS